MKVTKSGPEQSDPMFYVKALEKAKLAHPVFIMLAYENKIMRIWIDKNFKPYKVEWRVDGKAGYYNIDEFMRKVDLG